MNILRITSQVYSIEVWNGESVLEQWFRTWQRRSGHHRLILRRITIHTQKRHDQVQVLQSCGSEIAKNGIVTSVSTKKRGNNLTSCFYGLANCIPVPVSEYSSSVSLVTPVFLSPVGVEFHVVSVTCPFNFCLHNRTTISVCSDLSCIIHLLHTYFSVTVDTKI